MSSDQLILGVDAGGTKTNAWLAWARQPHSAQFRMTPISESIQLIGRGTAGPGNPRAVGFEHATHSIWTAVQNAYQDAALKVAPAAAACLGVAGAGRLAEQSQLHAWCQSRNLATHIQTVGDAVPVLAAACGHFSAEQLRTPRGMALISGTGSLAWGCNGVDRNGELVEARVGGWGYLLGDEGSGYWIALAGLRAACRAADGVGPDTELLPALLAALHLNGPQELIGEVYGQPVDRRRLAQLAPVIMNLAASQHTAGDLVAAQIIEQAAVELSQMVSCLLQKLGLDACQAPLALTGGVLQHGTRLRERLIELLRPHQLEIQVVEAPVLGAVYLAATALHVTALR